jgi:hypothetical protein
MLGLRRCAHVPAKVVEGRVLDGLREVVAAAQRKGEDHRGEAGGDG